MMKKNIKTKKRGILGRVGAGVVLMGVISVALLGSVASVYAEGVEFLPASEILRKEAALEGFDLGDSGDLRDGGAEGKGVKEDGVKESEGVDKVFEESGDQKFLRSISGELRAAQSDYKHVDDNIRDLEEKIQAMSGEQSTLKRQLSLLNYHMQYTELLIANVQGQISSREGEIAKLEEEVKIKEIEIEELRRVLIEYLQIVYMQQNEYGGLDNDYDKVLKILFSDESVGDVLETSMYYSFLEDQGNQLMNDFLVARGVFQVKQKEMEEANERLQELRYKLKNDRKRFALQQAAQEQLLADTQGKEEIYRELVEASRKQQDEIVGEIVALQGNIDALKKNFEKYGEYFDVEDYRKIVDKRVGEISDLPEDGIEFRWPVMPSLGISAYFHDSSYVGVFGVAHNAIDIPTTQGTPIRAAADAVVYKATDNGYGYSSIVLAHRGGYMTLYGHVSEIDVEEGQKVHEGQIIGLTGGTPGTKGAGYMTTGAHLHFEMFKGGKHFDPLEKLPLSYLPVKFWPENR